MKRIAIIAVVLLLLSTNPIHSQGWGIRYRDKIFSQVDITRNITYGQNYENGIPVLLKMDVYEPHGDTASKRAVVICIHGGGFTKGDKSNRYMVEICYELALRGYVAASINYRLQPPGNVNYGKAITEAMHDAKAAVRYFRRYAVQWRVDTDRIAILGSSAGAITALHACYLREAKYEGDSGNAGYSSNVSACIDLWGGLFGNVSQIDENEPPILIIHGTADKVVPFSEALNITKRCKEVGVYYKLHALPGEGHAPWHMINQFISWIVDFLYKKMIGVKYREILRFIFDRIGMPVWE